MSLNSQLNSKTAKDDGTKKLDNECPHSVTSKQKHERDHWRSWMSLTACFYIQCFISYVTPCYGVFFSQKLKTFPDGPLIRSSLFTLHILLWDVGSLFSPTIVASHGHRGTSFVALITGMISFVLLAVVEGSEALFVAYGILLGLSGGFLSNTTVLIIPQYFEKYRNSAFSLVSVGMAFSGIMTPRLVRHLMDSYGYSGGLLLYGACLLQACVLVALFQPHMKGPNSTDNLGSNKALLTKNKPEPKKRWACCKTTDFVNKVKTWFRDNYHAMKNMSVLLPAVGRGLFHSSLFNFYAFLPFFLENNGYSRNFSAACISNSSVMSLASRIIITFAIDHRWFHKRCLLVTSISIACVSNFGLIIGVENENICIALSFFYGLGNGMFSSIYYATLIDVVGFHLFQKCLAVNALFLALSDTLMSLFSGLISDLSGSYSPVLSACALVKFCAAVVFGGLFCRMKLKKSHTELC